MEGLYLENGDWANRLMWKRKMTKPMKEWVQEKKEVNSPVDYLSIFRVEEFYCEYGGSRFHRNDGKTVLPPTRQ
jgi:hypothetical protein